MVQTCRHVHVIRFQWDASDCYVDIPCRVFGICQGNIDSLRTHKLSNSHYTTILHVASDGTYMMQGARARLDLDPTNRTCRIYNETFSFKVNLTSGANVNGFRFEIHFNSTLLDYFSITWNAWGSGTINADENNGILTGSTSGSELNGTKILITVKFKVAFYHIWRSSPNWTNNLTDTIFIQQANISISGGPGVPHATKEAGNQPDRCWTRFCLHLLADTGRRKQ